MWNVLLDAGAEILKSMIHKLQRYDLNIFSAKDMQ